MSKISFIVNPGYAKNHMKSYFKKNSHDKPEKFLLKELHSIIDLWGTKGKMVEYYAKKKIKEIVEKRIRIKSFYYSGWDVSVEEFKGFKKLNFKNLESVKFWLEFHGHVDEDRSYVIPEKEYETS